MTIYQFEDIDPSLRFMPVAVRRCLDVVGLKLSLEAWQSLEPVKRRHLLALGAAPTIDIEAVRKALVGVEPAPKAIEPRPEPSVAEVPRELAAALTARRPLALGTWASLDPLARYALVKLASGGRSDPGKPANLARLERAYHELVGQSGTSSHLAREGGARMVSVSQKPVTLRRAVAASCVSLNPAALTALVTNSAPKGDVLGTARLAGIMAAKKTSELIPLCHPLALSRCDLELTLDEARSQVVVRAAVEAIERTGVEMEALVAASAAALTVYDMLKGLDRGMQIGPTRLLEKTGGKGGDFKA